MPQPGVLGLCDRLSADAIQLQTAGVSRLFDNSLYFTMTNDNHVCAATVLDILWKPCVSHRDIGCFGHHIITIVASIVLEEPVAPIVAVDVVVASHVGLRIVTATSHGLDAVAGRWGIGNLVSKVDCC